MAEGTLPGTRPSQKTAGPGRAGRAITRPGGEDGRRITIHAGVSIVRPARGPALILVLMNKMSSSDSVENRNSIACTATQSSAAGQSHTQ